MKTEMRPEAFECLLNYVYSIVEDVARACLTHSGGDEPTVEFTVHIVINEPRLDWDDWTCDCYLSSEGDDEAREFNFYCHFNHRNQLIDKNGRDGYFRYLREHVRQWIKNELSIVLVNEWGEAL